MSRRRSQGAGHRKARVDARGSSGILIGDYSRQVNNYYDPAVGMRSVRDDEALEDLAFRLMNYWERELAARGVIEAAPVRVSWSVTDGAALPSAELEPGPSAHAAGKIVPSKDVEKVCEEIVATFCRLENRLILVLGEPGAGKTVFAMLLTVGLIRRRIKHQSDGPVPVLLPIRDWDPQAEGVQEFVARRLEDDYRDLLTRHGRSVDIARRLVERQWILPVLDGLDEMPADSLPAAVAGLNLYAASRRLVITSRIGEYQQAVTTREGALSKSAVVRLKPVDVEAAIDYLSEDSDDSRWAKVFCRLRQDPSGELATALSTPLMVALTRTAYRDPDTTPADLLELTTTSQISGRLMDAFVVGAYRDKRPPEKGDHRRRYAPAMARRWLATIASQLYQTGRRDLLWWQLDPGLLATGSQWVQNSEKWVALTLVAVGARLAGWYAGGVWNTWWIAVAAVAVFWIGASDDQQRVWPEEYSYPHLGRGGAKRRQCLRSIGARLPFLLYHFGLILGFLTLKISGQRPSELGLWGLLAVGGLAALFPAAWRASPNRLRASPMTSLRVNHVMALVAAAQYGVISGVVFTIFAHQTHGRLQLPIVAAVVYAGTAWLAAGGWVWLRFRLAHARLAVKGQLPLRLWTFLEDAHRRDILHLSGVVYQFRHDLLREHLAGLALPDRLRARAVAGDHWAALRLATLLVRRGNVHEGMDVLRTGALSGDGYLAVELASVLARQGDIEEAIAVLRPPVAAGHQAAALQLANLLAGRGNVPEGVQVLRTCVDAESWYMAVDVATALARQGDIDGAVEILRPPADADWRSVLALSDLLIGCGRADEASTMLQAQVADGWDAVALADLMVAHEHPDAAIVLLQSAIDAGDEDAAYRLVDVHTARGDVSALRVMADAGDLHAAGRLIDLLASTGDLAGAIRMLRTRVAARVWGADVWLAHFLVLQGNGAADLGILGPRMKDGDPASVWGRAVLETRLGRLEEAKTALQRSADAGDRHARRRLDELTRPGSIDETSLRAWAAEGDWQAAYRLADLYVEQKRSPKAVDVLRPMAEDGHRRAVRRLAALLAQQGKVREALDLLRARVATDEWGAVMDLADQLDRLGRTGEAIDLLRPHAQARDRRAARRLAGLLTRQERVGEALDILRVRVAANEWGAVMDLADQLDRLGRTEEAIDVLRLNADHPLVDHLLAALPPDPDDHDTTESQLSRAASGRDEPATSLADLMVRRGHIDEIIGTLRLRASAATRAVPTRDTVPVPDSHPFMTGILATALVLGGPGSMSDTARGGNALAIWIFPVAVVLGLAASGWLEGPGALRRVLGTLAATRHAPGWFLAGAVTAIAAMGVASVPVPVGLAVLFTIWLLRAHKWRERRLRKGRRRTTD